MKNVIKRKIIMLMTAGFLVLGLSSSSQALQIAGWGDWDDGMDPNKFNGAVGVDASDNWGQVFGAGQATDDGPWPYMPNLAAVEIFPWSSDTAYTTGDITLEIHSWYGTDSTGVLYTETFSPINVPAYNTDGVLLELATPVSIADIGELANYAVVVKSDNVGLWISNQDPYTATSVGRLIRNGVLQLADQDMAMTIYSDPTGELIDERYMPWTHAWGLDASSVPTTVGQVTGHNMNYLTRVEVPTFGAPTASEITLNVWHVACDNCWRFGGAILLGSRTINNPQEGTLRFDFRDDPLDLSEVSVTSDQRRLMLEFSIPDGVVGFWGASGAAGYGGHLYSPSDQNLKLNFDIQFIQYGNDVYEAYEVFKGDINRDFSVDLADLLLLVADWLKCSDPLDSECDQYWITP